MSHPSLPRVVTGLGLGDFGDVMVGGAPKGAVMVKGFSPAVPVHGSDREECGGEASDCATAPPNLAHGSENSSSEYGRPGLTVLPKPDLRAVEGCQRLLPDEGRGFLSETESVKVEVGWAWICAWCDQGGAAAVAARAQGLEVTHGICARHKLQMKAELAAGDWRGRE